MAVCFFSCKSLFKGGCACPKHYDLQLSRTTDSKRLFSSSPNFPPLMSDFAPAAYPYGLTNQVGDITCEK